MPQNNFKRNFIIGDEWLYYKIYVGPKSADFILTDVLLPLTNKLLQEKVIDKWFFIRYSDPDLHLRVRFHVNNDKKLISVISNFNKGINPFIEKRIVWKLQVDTYKREIERYYEKTMVESENLFYLDSQCTLNFLDLIEGDEGEEYRWLYGLRSIDCLLSDFGYNLKDKTEILDEMQTSFGQEFNINKSLRRQLDNKFRKYREKITTFLKPAIDENSELFPIWELLGFKSEKSVEIVQSIKLKLSVEKIDSLLRSYIHMILNRLFRTKQRVHELAIYYMLHKHYKSEIGRQKSVTKKEKHLKLIPKSF